MASKAAWNARKGRSSSWCNPATRAALYLRDRFRCCYCGRDLASAEPRELTLDHLRCRDEGGTNDPSNLVLACLRCNSARGSRQKWYDYAPAGAVDHIKRQRRRVLPRALGRALALGLVTREQALAEAKR